jgi:hypothetical protein
MNESENVRWQNLLSLSASTFTGEETPPYGFTTRFLAQLRAENQQRELVERIGLRALFASLGVLLLAALVTLGVDHQSQGDLEPGVRNILQVDNIQLS